MGDFAVHPALVILDEVVRNDPFRRDSLNGKSAGPIDLKRILGIQLSIANLWVSGV